MKNSIFNAVCKTRYLALLVVLIFTCGNAWGADPTLVITRSCFPSGSLAYNVTDAWTATASTGETINGEGDLYSTASQTTMQTKNSSVSTHYHNLTAIPGAITNISVDVASGTDRKYEVYASSSAIITSNTGLAKLGDLTGASSVDLPAASKYRYFWLQCTGGASFLNNITITYEEPSYTFTRISSVGDLEAGDDIVIVNQSENYALSTTQNTNNRGRASISATNHTFTYSPSSGVQVLTVSINSGYYSFHDGTGYLKQPSDNNYLQRDAALGDNTKWSLSVSNYVFSITSKRNSQYYIAYNSGSSIFSAYKENQEKPYIYKRQTSTCANPTAATKGTFNRSTQKMPISWTSAAGKVDICYSSSSPSPGATPSASYTVVSNQTSSPVNLDVSSLAAGNYYCWVRSVCDADSRSDWVAVTGNYFTIPSHTLTVSPSPASSGTFTKSPNVTSVVEGRTVSITATPAAGYNFTSWAVSGTNASLSSTSTNPTTFTMGTANATVTGTFTANEVTGWTWKQQSEGSTEITIPAVVDLYVGQQAWFNLKSYTPDVIDAKKGYNASYSTTYLAQDNKAGTYYRTRAKEPTESTTLTFTSTSNSSVTQVITIRITALPYATFTDIIHGETFGDVTATVDATDKRIVTTTLKTPTHSDLSDPGSGNECERNHLHLAGWILKDWADEHPDATSSQISDAGAGNFYAPDADIDLVAKNGKTFYAVWAKLQ